MYEYQVQPHTREIITRPQENVIYKFSYGPSGKERIYQTGDRVFPEQDIIIMPIPREETRVFDKEGRLYVWFQCRICGKLAYGTMHQAKNKNSPRYNPCGCWKKSVLVKQEKELALSIVNILLNGLNPRKEKLHLAISVKLLDAKILYTLNNIVKSIQKCNQI